MGFGERGKLRALHADIGAAAMDSYFGAVAGLAEQSSQLRANGFRETDVRGHAIPEKSGHAVPGAIVELVGNQEIERFQILLKRTDGADRDDSLDAELFHSVNVGAIIYFCRQKTVPARVACKKRDALPFQLADNERVGRVAERSFYPHLARVFEARHGVEAAAANNADANRFGNCAARF